MKSSPSLPCILGPQEDDRMLGLDSSPVCAPYVFNTAYVTPQVTALLSGNSLYFESNLSELESRQLHSPAICLLSYYINSLSLNIFLCKTKIIKLAL